MTIPLTFAAMMLLAQTAAPAAPRGGSPSEAPPLTSDPALRDAEQKIADLVRKLQSVRATLQSHAERHDGPSKLTAESNGTYEFLRGEHAFLYRTELTSVQKDASGKIISRRESLDVSDGRFRHKLVTQDGKTSATRTMAEIDFALTPFKFLHRDYAVRLAPDQTIDGKPTWVIEGVPLPKSAMDGRIGRLLQFYQKETGVLVRVETHDTAGRVMASTTYRDVVINAPIPPGRFEFKAPPGVTVVDDLPQAPAAPPASQPGAAR